MMTKFIYITFICLLSACSNIKQVHYYHLQKQQFQTQDTPKVAKTHNNASIGIRSVKLPSMLERHGIVSNNNNSNITVASHHVWAGRLNENFTNVLAETMSKKLGVTAIATKPWNTNFRPNFQLEYDIHQFSGELGGKVQLKISWILSKNFGKTKLLSRSYDLSVQSKGDSYSDYVDALNLLLEKFCDKSAQEIIANQYI